MSERKPDPSTTSLDPQEAASDEDTQAILSRRSFLIETTLVNAGLGVGLGACRPQVSLKNVPHREDTIAPSRDAGMTQKPPVTKPRVCLSPPIRPPIRPQVCLKIPPPRDAQVPRPPTDATQTTQEDAGPQPTPRVCLKVAPPRPHPCLKRAPRRPKSADLSKPKKS